MHFNIGYHDGTTAAYNDWGNGCINYAKDRCPAGHTKEYCQGYEDGYNNEGYELVDA